MVLPVLETILNISAVLSVAPLILQMLGQNPELMKKQERIHHEVYLGAKQTKHTQKDHV